MTAIELQGAYNVRDLGGLRTKDRRITRPGVIYRGDSLDNIAPGDAKILFDKLGIGTIVDLRTAAETEGRELNFPVHRVRYSVLVEGRLGHEPFPSDDPVELAKVYLSNIDSGRTAVQCTFNIVADNLQAGVATLFHCAAGRDRTGIMAAVLLGLVGVTDGQIAMDYVQSNRNARRVTKKLAENPLYKNHEKDRPEVILLHERSILGFMRLLREEFGGPRQFCLDCGIPEETISIIENRFVISPPPASPDSKPAIPAALAAGPSAALPPDSPTRRERELRAELRRTPGYSVLTGGQTGVDTAAAAAALGAGLPVHVVFPRGFRQEDGRITPERRHELRGAMFHELTSSDFTYRTWTCVYLADAVILIDPAGGEGCQETIRAADRLGRPLLNLTPDQETVIGPAEVRAWLNETGARVLMIAGCRQSVLASQGKSDSVRQLVDMIAAVVTESSPS
jgi:protein-tyrosine phosphatase